MDYLYKTRFYHIKDITDGNFQETKENPSLLALWIATDYEDVESVVYFFEPSRLPYPERELLSNKDNLIYIDGVKVRPVEILTRAECNTISGRTKLLEWEQSRPYIDGDFLIDGFEMREKLHGNRRNQFDGTQTHTPQQTIQYIIRFAQNPNNTFNGLWERFKGHSLLSYATDCAWYHPDLMFANIEGHEITTRDEFKQAVEKYAVPLDFNVAESSSRRDRIKLTRDEVIKTLLQIYDDSQHLIDCLFATYELFRTEQYASIVEMPLTAQRVAIRNYLSTFRTYNAKSGTNRTFPLEYKGAVAANVRKRLNIPDEVFIYANKKFRIEPLKDEKKAIPHTTKDNFVAVGTTVFDQRTDGLNNRQLTLFEDELGVVKLEDIPLSLETLLSWVVFDTKQFKFLNEVLFAVASRNNFDWEEYAHRVMMVRTSKDIVTLYKDPVQIEINDILRHLFGKVSDKTRKDFEKIFDSLPREYFKFPLYIDKTTRGGETIRIKIDEKDRQKYIKKGYKDLTIYGKRFNLLNVIEEKAANGKPKYSAVIQVNPIYYANMIDKYGNPTNYQKIDDGLRTFISSLNKTDVVTPAVYKILFPIHRQCFASAAQAARAAKKNTKQTTYDYDTERAQRFARSIYKDDLYSAVLRNAGLKPENNMTKQRIRTKIADALEMMQKNGVCIDTFATSTDGRAWNIIFIDPSK